MTIHRPTLKPGRRHAGTAMLETVLVLPLVFVILGLVFFFGNAFEREQQQRILARYEATRISNQATPASPAQNAGLNNHQDAMNDLFFENQAEFTNIEWHVYQEPAKDQLVNQAMVRSNPAGDLAAQIMASAPRGNWVDLELDFSRNNQVFEAVNGPIRRSSMHPGPSWAYADAMSQNGTASTISPPLTAGWVYDRQSGHLRAEPAVRTIFYENFDNQLDNFSEPAARMVRLIRGMLYASQPGYRGPSVEFSR